MDVISLRLPLFVLKYVGSFLSPVAEEYYIGAHFYWDPSIFYWNNHGIKSLFFE